MIVISKVTLNKKSNTIKREICTETLSSLYQTILLNTKYFKDEENIIKDLQWQRTNRREKIVPKCVKNKKNKKSSEKKENRSLAVSLAFASRRSDKLRNRRFYQSLQYSSSVF